MTIDGFLTFLALLVAVSAVMSRAQRLNLLLKVRASDIVIAVFAFIAVNVLEFYEPLAKAGWFPDSAWWLLKPNENLPSTCHIGYKTLRLSHLKMEKPQV